MAKAKGLPSILNQTPTSFSTEILLAASTVSNVDRNMARDEHEELTIAIVAKRGKIV
jgi:hypothetical protein